MLSLLLLNMLLTLNPQRTEAWSGGTIYIRADGSVDPPDAPIIGVDDTYYLTDDVQTTSGDGIVVERDNIILDGNGHTITGPGNAIGVRLNLRVNVIIINMTITSFDTGISLEYSSNNKISGNNITNNEVGGVLLVFSSNNIISENNIVNKKWGIVLAASDNNVVSGNVFVNNGLIVSNSYQNTVVDNTVNGKPLVYLEGVSDYSIAGDAGQVILVKCRNIRVEGLNITRASIGIQLWMTNSSTITGNNVTNNVIGIDLRYSSNNVVSGNNITANQEINYGIQVSYSSNNIISGNNIANNYFGVQLLLSEDNSISGNNIANSNVGIWLEISSNNIISGNNIANSNRYGIQLRYNSNNRIFHNNFINNTFQVYSIESANVWDDGYPSGGNYWSDYAGYDGNLDGIGDAPYIIDSNNADNYPLISPFRSTYPKGYAVVRGLGGEIWFRELDDNWGGWTCIGGITPNAPSAAFYDRMLHVAVNDGNNGIWLGRVDPHTHIFTGWSSISGLTPSRPTLVSTEYGLIMVVRDISNGIWVYRFSDNSWMPIPGLTVDSPAATALGDALHLVVRGSDGISLWHGTLNLKTNAFSGWTPLNGLSNATPELSNNSSHIHLIVKATGNDVWMNTYNGSWLGWQPLPGGLTNIGPAAMTYDDKIMVMVKDLNYGIWINIYEGGAWKSWMPIDGLTDAQPELTSTG